MRELALSCLLLWPCAAFAVPPQRQYTELTSGRYTLKVSGMICTSCARAISVELGKIESVESAKVDFLQEQVLLTVRIESKLKASTLRRALHRAAKRINLGTKFEVLDIQYMP